MTKRIAKVPAIVSFAKFAKAEDEKFAAIVPEMSRRKSAVRLQHRAVVALRGLGFDEAELAASWNGQKYFCLRDHRMQRLINDAAAWRETQAQEWNSPSALNASARKLMIKRLRRKIGRKT